MKGSLLTVQVTTADVPGVIDAMNHIGIALYDVQQPDSLTVSFTLLPGDLAPAEAVVRKGGGKLSVISPKKRTGEFSWIQKRLVLILGLGVLLWATMFLPTRILFVQVLGNTVISEREILEHAAQCGIKLGIRAREIRSEQVKNSLLEEIPQLQWVGVNTSGCVAVISVKERDLEENSVPEPAVSSLVAVCDGIIHSCTATKGSLVCTPGQAVKAGQILISGYTDCGLTIRAGKAEGEVFAQTLHKLCVKVPLNWTRKGEIFRTEEKYSLIIGKKRINFYKDSGILGASCDKMYTQYILTLPGGFQLPVSVLVETRLYREDQPVNAQMQDMSAVAADTAQAYLKDQMLGGRIIHSTYSQDNLGDALILGGEYRCIEMIGRIRGEEIIQYHGENH